MSDEADASFGQCFDDFAFYSAGDGHAVEGAVDGFGVIEGAGTTFFRKSAGLDDFGVIRSASEERELYAD